MIFVNNNINKTKKTISLQNDKKTKKLTIVKMAASSKQQPKLSNSLS